MAHRRRGNPYSSAAYSLSPLQQPIGGAVELPGVDGDDAVGGGGVDTADGAGIHEIHGAVIVHQGRVGVAEDHLLFLNRPSEPC